MGLGLGVQGSGLGFWGLGFRVLSLRLRSELSKVSRSLQCIGICGGYMWRFLLRGLGRRFSGVRFRVQGS